MYAIGAPVYLSATFTDRTGAPVDPDAVTVTITLPDGTTTGALSATKSSTGNYFYQYEPATAGIYQYYFAGTGANGGVQLPDIFTVDTLLSAALISISDAKAILNKSLTDHTDDLEILSFIQAATEIINSECGYTIPTTFTETTEGLIGAGGRQVLMLSRTPVLSVQSITPRQLNLPTIDISTLNINNASGVIYLANYYSWFGPQLVTYTAGRTSIPPALQEACKLIVAYFWETQRGGAISTSVAGFGGQDFTASSIAEPGFPTRALDLMRMAPHYAAPGLA